MVFRLHSLLILFCATAVRPAIAAPSTTGVIQQFPLDERRVYEIAIGQDVPTTLMFPSALTAIEGANISAKVDTPAPVILAYTAGRNFLTVRATEAGAKAAVNVIWKNKTFVLRFLAKEEPCSSVTFFEEKGTPPNQNPVAAFKSPSSKTLMTLLDEAKNCPIVSLLNPEAMRQIERAQPRSVTYYADFHVTVEEVFRFDRQDTLVFQLRFENTSDHVVTYEPQQLAARVGSQIFPAAIVDASGTIPPKMATIAYFAIMGDAQGKRAEISLKNDFGIIVPRLEKDEPKGAR